MGSHGQSGVFLHFLHFSLIFCYFLLETEPKTRYNMSHLVTEDCNEAIFERIDETMSASASKKKRKQLQEQGGPLLSATKVKEDDQKKKNIRTAILFASIIALTVVAVILFVYFLHAPKYNTKKPVASVGEEKITVPVYNHFYNYALENSGYGMYAYYAQQNPGLHFSEIKLGETTLEASLIDATNQNIEEIYNLYIDAKKNNFTLSEESKAGIEAQIAQLKTVAEQSGYKKLDRYMSDRFGSGCTEKSYREYLTVLNTASEYYSKLNKEYTLTDEQVNETYTKDPSAYDVVNYTYATIKAPSDDEKEPAEENPAEENPTEAPTEEAPTEENPAEEAPTEENPAEENPAEENPAEETPAEENPAEENPAEENPTEENPTEENPAEENTEEEDPNAMPSTATTKTASKADISASVTGDSELSKEIAEWLFASERKEGDMKDFGKEDGDKTRVRFNYRDDYDYCSVRAYVFSIPKSTAAAKEGEKTVEEKIAAIKALLTDELTDAEFGKIAKEYGGSESSEALDKNKYPKEVNDYLFSDTRKVGDTEIIPTEDAYYIVRYVSTEEHTCRFNIIRNESFSDMYEELIGANKIQIVQDMMKHATTDLMFNS